MTIEFGLLILGAYLLGSVPAAYLAARYIRGIDLRRYGSGNIGFTNLFESASRRVAFLIFIFDLAKGMVMVWITQLLGLGITPQVTVGLATIAGHNWPVFLHFNGGRGVLTALGVALILPSINNMVPWVAIIGLAITAIGIFILHNFPFGVGVAMVALPLVSWGFAEPLPFNLGFLAMFLILVIRRLTAPQTALSKSVPFGQLFINRLLFDRDIRDRKAWIHRNLPKASSTEQPVERQEKRKEG